MTKSKIIFAILVLISSAFFVFICPSRAYSDLGKPIPTPPPKPAVGHYLDYCYYMRDICFYDDTVEPNIYYNSAGDA